MAPGPRLGLGIGWRPELALAIDRRAHEQRDLGFVELLADNCDPRRPLPAPLRRLRDAGVRIVVHSVGLSLGGGEPVDQRRLDRLARIAEWAGAAVVSDHVAFVRAGGRGTGHLLPVQRSEVSLAVLCENVTRTQRALPVPLALENIAPLFDWPDATMDEPELLERLTAATGTRLIVDVSNLHASARNLGVDPRDWLARVPLDRLAYAHVGGGMARDGLWHDTHAHRIPREALALLCELARRAPIPGAMLERDDRFPEEAEVNGELDAIGAAMQHTDEAETSGGQHRERVASFVPPAPATCTTSLAAAQARLVGALVAGEPHPAGFDPRRLAIEAEMLIAKRLRVAARACPGLDLEGERRDQFTSWAQANPPPDDACGTTDGRAFAAAMASGNESQSASHESGPGRARSPGRKARGGGIPVGIVTTSNAADGARSRPGRREDL